MSKQGAEGVLTHPLSLLGFSPSTIGLGLTIVPRRAVSHWWGCASPHDYLLFVTIAYQICQRSLSLGEGKEGLALGAYSGDALDISVYRRSPKSVFYT